ncbi:signal peptidase I [Agrococcus jenensis]|uniref:Signal peptidase I n=1 Tax=Agrococcus jenensis TaxID=46353 RepID=A0A3N2AWA6_9MICO|nr:signal peptidase I [Agrococcus jenensis]ROR67317.1 signal peptidase I [Agrococcus jenensis]
MTETVETGAAGREQRSGGRGFLLFLRDLVVIFLIALLISFLVKTFLIRPFWIPSESMNETLQVDDRIIVSLLTPSVVAAERGDVVVFEDPGGWLPEPTPEPESGVFGAIDWFLTFVGLAPEDEHGYLIKRVIGLPGDRVQCCNDFGQLTINGVPIDEPYVHLDAAGQPASSVPFDVTVPEGHVWVLGDNRNHSGDSRAHMDAPGGGFVPIASIVGRAVLVSWPLERWTWLDGYEPSFIGVEPQSAPAEQLLPVAVAG